MHGDCSISFDPPPFTPEEISACAQQESLLSFELHLNPTSPTCSCAACTPASLSPFPSPLSPSPILTPDEILSLLRSAASIGCRRALFVNDHPTPYTPLRLLIEETRRLNLHPELLTAGTDLTPTLASFLTHHRATISLKLESLTPTLHNQLADSPSAHQTFLTALAHLTASQFPAVDLAIRLPISPANLEEIPTLWRWCRTRNFSPRPQIITPRHAPTSSPTLIDPTRAKLLFETLAAIDAAEFSRPFSRQNSSPSLIGRSCNRHLFACHITPCGTVFACVGITIPLGNIRTQPLADILSHSEVLENLRAFSSKVKEPCRTCCKTTPCYGCRGAAFQLTGDYLAGDPLCWKSYSVPIPTLPTPATPLIPHGPSMQLIHRILSIGEHEARTDFTVPQNSPLLTPSGTLDETAFIEMLAQSLAASHGFHLSENDRLLHKGFLIGIKNFRISAPARPGDTLTIHLHKLLRFAGTILLEGSIHNQHATLLAQGQIKLYRPD